MIDDPVHDGMLRQEGDGLHAAPLMEPLTLLHEYCKAAELGTDHGVDFIDLPDHGSASPSSMRLPNQGRPAFGRKSPELLLGDPQRRRTRTRLPFPRWALAYRP